MTSTIRIARTDLATYLTIVLGGIAAGETRLTKISADAGVSRTIDAMAAMGAIIRNDGDDLVIKGTGNGALLQAEHALDFSGVPIGAKLILGLVGTYDMETSFAGILPETLEPVIAAIGQMGLQRRSDLSFAGAKRSNPISYRLSDAAPEMTAAILLAALNAPGITTVIEDVPSDKTILDLFAAFGATVEAETDDNGARHIRIHGEPKLSGLNIDFS
jgi:3-phosphoshikimate 1-carboxyvinyltransferase